MFILAWTRKPALGPYKRYLGSMRLVYQPPRLLFRCWPCAIPKRMANNERNSSGVVRTILGIDLVMA